MPITPTSGTGPLAAQQSKPTATTTGKVAPGILASGPLAGVATSSDAAGAGLLTLARRPMLALGQWQKLTAAQQSLVVTAMTKRYGSDFTSDFLSYARGVKKHNLCTEVTNTQTPESMAARGFKYAGDLDGIRVWVHPSGYEYWLIGSGTSASSPAKAASAPQVAREEAEYFDARFDALQDERAALKALENPKGTFPKERLDTYHANLKGFTQYLTSVLEVEVPLWRDAPLSAKEKDALENQIARIEAVKQHLWELQL